MKFIIYAPTLKSHKQHTTLARSYPASLIHDFKVIVNQGSE